MKQLSFSDAEYAGKRKAARREVFLAEMDKVVPWVRLVSMIEPVYPKPGKGRRPYSLETMLRIHFMQQWFSLSDLAMEESLYDIASMRQFAGLLLTRGSVPDETTILNFRHLLEKHQLAEQLLAQVNTLLSERGLLLRQGTIVDAAIISAPSSTKNQNGTHDPEMHQTKKGNAWHFGMKAHIGVDADSGLVHTCNDPAEPAHLKRLTQMFQPGFSCQAPGVGAGGCKNVSSRRSPGWHVAASRSDAGGHIVL